MNAFLAVSLFLIILVIVFMGFAALLWWLVPLAFPGLVFGFPNALALTAILTLIGGPALKD